MDTNGSKTLLALGQRLPGLLKRLRAAANSAATVAQQLEAFSDGCEILSQVVDWLDKEKTHIKSLEAALGQFLLSIPKSKLDEFLDAEAELLRSIGLPNTEIEAVLTALRQQSEQGDLSDLGIDAAQLRTALVELRDVFCNLKQLSKGGWKVSKETVDECIGSVLAVCAISGDLLSVPIGFAAGPLGISAAVLLAVGSVGSGVRSLWKQRKKLKELFSREQREQEARKKFEADVKAMKENFPPKKLGD